MVLKLHCFRFRCAGVFENDVEMYGAQTHNTTFYYIRSFENDVEMYGAQTPRTRQRHRSGLRMM